MAGSGERMDLALSVPRPKMRLVLRKFAIAGSARQCLGSGRSPIRRYSPRGELVLANNQPSALFKSTSAVPSIGSL